MLRNSIALAAVSLVAILVLIVVLAERGRRDGATDSAERVSVAQEIEVSRVEPSGDPTAEIECASLAFVEFSYRVSNRGDAPITGLKLGTKCSCEQVGNPPADIPPGGSAQVRFRLRAPYVGRMRRKIPLTVNGESEPITAVDVSLHVKFEPPGLVPLQGDLSLSFIAGDRSPRELVFEAIEARREQPWIRGLKFNLNDGIDVQPRAIEELAEPDSDLARRRYHFAIVNRSLPVGMRMGTARIETRKGLAPVRDSVAIWVNVLHSIAILPNPLVIKCGGEVPAPPGRVRVVSRTGGGAPIVPGSYDRDRLHIQAVGEQAGCMALFEIAAIGAGGIAGETRVAFNVDGADSQDLVVRFEPMESR